MDERRKKLEETMKGFNKKTKDKMFDFADNSPDKEVIPFGIKELDDFLGGGVSLRKITVDYGAEDTGKSTRALHLVGNAQKEGKLCCYIDMENKFDKARAEQMGVKLDELAIMQGVTTAEAAMDAIITLAKEQAVDLIIVDSIQAMSPKGEQETKKGKLKSIEDDEMALLARKLGKFFRVAGPQVFRGKVAVYMIGQIRMNIGGFFAFADLSGGAALKHYMSQCIYSRKGQKSDAPVEKIKEYFEDPEGKQRYKTVSKPVGFDCVLKMIKSHVSDSAKENEEIHVPFYYETGFKKLEENTKEESKPVKPKKPTPRPPKKDKK